MFSIEKKFITEAVDSCFTDNRPQSPLQRLTVVLTQQISTDSRQEKAKEVHDCVFGVCRVALSKNCFYEREHLGNKRGHVAFK